MIIIKYCIQEKEFAREIISESKLKIISDNVFSQGDLLGSKTYYYITKCLKYSDDYDYIIITKSLKNNKEIKIYFSDFICDLEKYIKDCSCYIKPLYEKYTKSYRKYARKTSQKNKFLSYVSIMMYTI